MSVDEFDTLITQRWKRLHAAGQDDALARACFGLACDLQFNIPADDLSPKMRRLIDGFVHRMITYAEEHIPFRGIGGTPNAECGE